MNGVRHFLLALQFFTRIPVTGRLAQWVGYSPAMLRASAAHFPAVGWVVGAIGALALAAALALWTPLIAAVLCTVVTVLVTGAFHEDGLADVADGLGGASTRERALEIMKDSRIGAFGAIAVVLALGLKFALLAALAGQGAFVACAALLAAHVLSRLAPLAVMRASPYVGGEGGKSKPMADAVSGTAVFVAVLWSLPAAALLVIAGGVVNGVAAVVAGALVALFMVRLLRRRLGGFTGDGLGATQQLSELAIYLALAARL
jgi:adenosylcobinamide-GDP ribazoletransferase